MPSRLNDSLPRFASVSLRLPPSFDGQSTVFLPRQIGETTQKRIGSGPSAHRTSHIARATSLTHNRVLTGQGVEVRVAGISNQGTPQRFAPPGSVGDTRSTRHLDWGPEGNGRAGKRCLGNPGPAGACGTRYGTALTSPPLTRGHSFLVPSNDPFCTLDWTVSGRSLHPPSGRAQLSRSAPTRCPLPAATTVPYNLLDMHLARRLQTQVR